MSDAPELFSSEEGRQDSPRRVWLLKHGIITWRTPLDPYDWLAGVAGNADMGTDHRKNWFANETAHNGESRIGLGFTEDEALADLAKLRGLPLWNEEPLAGKGEGE